VKALSSFFLDALLCKPVEKTPVWLMRQAGRYLPEYRALRERYTLHSLFHEPELATIVTLMPFERFPLDAAIVFSDLLVIAEVWGKKVFYPESGGPYIAPKVQGLEDIFIASREELKERLFYVFDTIRLLKPLLHVPLIGFCGAPFTLLCYLLEGKGGGSFSAIRQWMDHRSKDFHILLDRICETAVLYIRLQIEAGVEAVQIFDSWTHLLSEQEFLSCALFYWEKMKRLLEDLKVPLIFFSRTNSRYPKQIASIHPAAISFDEERPLEQMRKIVPSHIAVQGNFSPERLVKGSIQEIQEEASKMASSVRGEKGVIFNLGHGVLPNTPISHVHAFLEALY
jgi:uroporphyrinogen decarboxylase